MKVTIKKFQEGGAMPEEQMEAPVEEAPAQQDPMMMLAEAAAQALQQQSCEIAFQVCQGFLSLIQQAGGQMEAEPQGEPVFRKGGVLVRRIKK